MAPAAPSSSTTPYAIPRRSRMARPPSQGWRGRPNDGLALTLVRCCARHNAQHKSPGEHLRRSHQPKRGAVARSSFPATRQLPPSPRRRLRPEVVVDEPLRRSYHLQSTPTSYNPPSTTTARARSSRSRPPVSSCEHAPRSSSPSRISSSCIPSRRSDPPVSPGPASKRPAAK